MESSLIFHWEETERKAEAKQMEYFRLQLVTNH